MDDDDFYGDEDRCIGAEQTTNHVASKLYKDGYRIGKAKEEEKLMQEGFDIGFHRGVMIGRACGELYGACRVSLQSSTTTTTASNTIENTTPEEALKQIERLLFEELPHMDEYIDNTWIEELRNAVLAVAVDLEPKFHLFMEHIEEFGGSSTTTTTTNTT